MRWGPLGLVWRGSECFSRKGKKQHPRTTLPQTSDPRFSLCLGICRSASEGRFTGVPPGGMRASASPTTQPKRSEGDAAGEAGDTLKHLTWLATYFAQGMFCS